MFKLIQEWETVIESAQMLKEVNSVRLVVHSR
jgi:hypothetical protein